MLEMAKAREMKLRKNNKKGFTLVEIIVVLVILAILAAILVPSMIGWIDKANQKTSVVAARTELVAAQTIASENYAKYETATSLDSADVTAAEELADVEGADITATTIDGGQVTEITVEYNDYTCTYEDGEWTVSK